MRILFAVFLLGHAGVHAVMWTLPFTDAAVELPFDPGHSWLLGDHRVIAAGLAAVTAVAFIVAGGAYLGYAAWWPAALIGASVTSLLLMGVYFTPWWLVGIALSGALALYAIQASP